MVRHLFYSKTIIYFIYSHYQSDITRTDKHCEYAGEASQVKEHKTTLINHMYGKY